MTHPNPDSGHAPALPADGGLTVYGPRTLSGLLSIENRISAWCEWFGIEEPKLKRNRKRDVLLNDDLVAWLYASGASFDWIVVGDVRGMAAAFRKSERDLRRFQAVLKQFDDTEVRLMLDTLNTYQARGVPLEEALEAFKEAVEAHRAQKAAGASQPGLHGTTQDCRAHPSGS